MTNFVPDYLITQDNQQIKKIILSQLLVKMHVKVIPAVHSFAPSMTKQFWLELFHMEVDVAKKENLVSTQKSIIYEIGFNQVVKSLIKKHINVEIFQW